MIEGVEPLVIFTPAGRRGHVPAGTTVLDAARSLGVDIDSVCGGRGICGRCQVTLGEGEFPKHGIVSTSGHLSPNRDAASEFGERTGIAADRRLACLAEVLGDVLVDVPPESQVHRQVVRKDLGDRAFDVDPVVRLHYVEVEPPTLASPSGALTRLLAALEREWQLTGLDADLHAVRDLQGAVAAGGGSVTVAVHDGRTITAVWPGFRDVALGVAIDVGSTTIAGHLADLSSGRVLASHGVMNPQIRFGEDLMSRVSYAMLHDGGAREMTRVVRGALVALVRELTTQAAADTSDVLEITLVGNPIMHHLALGLDPIPLGTAPFELATERALRLRARDVGLAGHPGARVYVLPCIAGHVGADTAAVILSEADRLEGPSRLIVDVGTNAEIVLAANGRLLAASSPTGPAFEGAQISSGQRAAPGAIERVRIDRSTLEPRYRVIGVPMWSDEPGFDEAIAAIGISGICGSGIVEVVAELFLAGVITADGAIDGAIASRTRRVVADGRTFSYVLVEGERPVHVTQNDVRAIQLAKAALYAGARLLMDHAGIDGVEEVGLAGAFGNQIDPLHAMVLGLIPDADLERTRGIGNAAGTGALMALLSGTARSRVEGLVRRVEKIETAVEPRFQEHFVEALAFPHASAPSTHLASRIDLPARTPAGDDGRRRGLRDRRHVRDGVAAGRSQR